jgi:hypothetical protein
MRLRLSASWSLLFVAGLCFPGVGCASKNTGPVDLGDDSEGGSGSSTGGGGTGSTSGSTGSGGGETSSSGSGSTSGSGSGSGSSSGSHPDAGTVLVIDAGGPPPLPADPTAPSIGQCGSTANCDLRTQTCCVGVDAHNNVTGKCISHGAACPILTAAFSCYGESDCPSGKVCCGTATSASAGTACATSCPTQGNSMQGQAQICKGDAECQNKMQCIPQTCLDGANLDLCGLTSQAPFMCTAAQ